MIATTRKSAAPSSAACTRPRSTGIPSATAGTVSAGSASKVANVSRFALASPAPTAERSRPASTSIRYWRRLRRLRRPAPPSRASCPRAARGSPAGKPAAAADSLQDPDGREAGCLERHHRGQPGRLEAGDVRPGGEQLGEAGQDEVKETAVTTSTTPRLISTRRFTGAEVLIAVRPAQACADRRARRYHQSCGSPRSSRARTMPSRERAALRGQLPGGLACATVAVNATPGSSRSSQEPVSVHPGSERHGLCTVHPVPPSAHPRPGTAACRRWS